MNPLRYISKIDTFLGSLYENLSTAKQLENAVNKDNLQKLDDLILEGVDINKVIQKQGENTPLHLAARKGHHRCIQRLLGAGADASVKNHFERTPLFIAFVNGHVKCVEILLCVDTSIKTLDVLWSYSKFCKEFLNNFSDEMISVLVRGTPTIDINRNNFHNNMLSLCIRRCYRESLKLYVLTGNRFPDRQLEYLSEWRIMDDDQCFVGWLTEYKKTPQSLQHCARLSVRRAMAGKSQVFLGTQSLEIPKTLKSYLCFADE